MDIEQQLNSVKESLPQEVQLIAVSKTKPDELILKAYEAGQRHFGENKVQELAGKYERLPKDICWHLIGHLQTNKVKYIAPFVHLIHAVDSVKLLKEIQKRAFQHDRQIGVLLQVHIAEEESKFGMSFNELRQMLTSASNGDYPNVAIAGIMAMATNTNDTQQIEQEFNTVNQEFISLQQQHPYLKTLSMGMSNDYTIAIACGSNMVRVGSAIFGARNYQ